MFARHAHARACRATRVIYAAMRYKRALAYKKEGHIELWRSGARARERSYVAMRVEEHTRYVV